MKLQTAIKKATEHLLKSDKARTYQTPPDVWGDRKSYTLELTRDTSGDSEYANWLEVTTWGFDYQGIEIPTDRPSLINHKCRAQMASDPVAKIALRYYLDILHRETA